MKLNKLIRELEGVAPLYLQESYDNSGLLVGDINSEINSALITLDITEAILDEAIANGCELIIAHHPIIFKGFHSITGENYNERVIINAIKNDISIYTIHTNLDNISQGVNSKICEMLGVRNPAILKPKAGLLRKLVVFCPLNEAEKVRQAIFNTGAGYIGNYDSCSFNLEGSGSFRANENADPYVGEIGKLHFEKEVRIESVYPVYKEKEIISSMITAHPYEEVAYDIYPISNELNIVGAGMIGELENPVLDSEFLEFVKKTMKAGCVRHTRLSGNELQRVAVCGGSGSFLIQDAIRAGADIFITGDIKYHDFFLPEGKTILADIGHYESEQFTKELIYSILKQKFSNFALLISEINTNPVTYL